jgi:hypothetical protein
LQLKVTPDPNRRIENAQNQSTGREKKSRKSSIKERNQIPRAGKNAGRNVTKETKETKEKKNMEHHSICTW